jgi:hypothetical protein
MKHIVASLALAGALTACASSTLHADSVDISVIEAEIAVELRRLTDDEIMRPVENVLRGQERRHGPPF